MTEEQRGMKARDTSKQVAGGSTASIVQATKSNELQSTHRVYVKEWLLTHSAITEEEVNAFYGDKYDGRLKDGDWKIEKHDEYSIWQLHLRLWNVKGEWKDEALANAHADEILEQADAGPFGAEDVQVVARNSRKEHMLASYGKLKLPASK